MSTKWLNEKENLEFLIFEENLSYEEIGRRYGCTGANIKKQAIKIGIELPKRRVINPSETFNRGTSLKKETSVLENNIQEKNSDISLVPIRVCVNCGNTLYSGKKYCCTQCQLEYQHKQQ